MNEHQQDEDAYAYPPIDTAVRTHAAEIDTRVEAWLAQEQGQGPAWLYGSLEARNSHLALMNWHMADVFAQQYAAENDQTQDAELVRALYRGSMLASEVCHMVEWQPRTKAIIDQLQYLARDGVSTEDWRHDNFARYVATRTSIDVFIDRYALHMQDQTKTRDCRDYSGEISVSMALAFQATEWAHATETMNEAMGW